MKQTQDKNINGLTKEQTESLVLYLQCFKSAYRFATGKDLKTVEQIIDLILEGKFTFDDVFDTYLDTCLNFKLDNKEGEFFDMNMEMFMCENYFPPKEKQVNEGAWIKIRTENGFEVHYAKKTNRKRRFNEEYEKIYDKLTCSFKQTIKGLSDFNNTKKVEEVLSPTKKEKQKKLRDILSELIIREIIGIKPYEIKINRTKSKTEYFLPYQYEIIDDVEEFSNAYVAEVPGVSVKRLFTSENKDIVFYLTSRGISKKTAEMLASLKQTYFKVNMEEAMKAYNDYFKACVKIVKKKV